MKTKFRPTRFRKFLKWFKAQPDEWYNQVEWEICGTPACIGGHMAAYIKAFSPRYFKKHKSECLLNIENGDMLSYFGITGTPFTAHPLHTRAAQKEDAVVYLENILRTKGVQCNWIDAFNIDGERRPIW